MKTDINMNKERRLDPLRLLPEGKYSFSIASAIQVNVGEYGEHIVIDLKIEQGPMEGKFARFFKPVLFPPPEIDNENEIVFIDDPSKPSGGIEIMSFPDWVGRDFKADVKYELGSGRRLKACLRNFDKYRIDSKEVQP